MQTAQQADQVVLPLPSVNLAALAQIIRGLVAAPLTPAFAYESFQAQVAAGELSTHEGAALETLHKRLTNEGAALLESFVNSTW